MLQVLCPRQKIHADLPGLKVPVTTDGRWGQLQRLPGLLVLCCRMSISSGTTYYMVLHGPCTQVRADKGAARARQRPRGRPTRQASDETGCLLANSFCKSRAWFPPAFGTSAETAWKVQRGCSPPGRLLGQGLGDKGYLSHEWCVPLRSVPRTSSWMPGTTDHFYLSNVHTGPVSLHMPLPAILQKFVYCLTCQPGSGNCQSHMLRTTQYYTASPWRQEPRRNQAPQANQVLRYTASGKAHRPRTGGTLTGQGRWQVVLCSRYG